MPTVSGFVRSVLCAVFSLSIAATGLDAADVIVDNSSTAFKVLSGSWSTGTATGMYGSNYRYAKTSTRVSAQVQWQPTLPSAGDYQVFVWYPAASNRPTDARFTVYYNGGSQTFAVNQTANGGQWVALGTFNFAAGSSTNGRVTLTNLSIASNKRVAADAVRFYKPDPVDLTMAVSPAGAGATTPAVGGPYPYTQGDVVSITAAPAAGYRFDHWTVSGGSQVAAPYSASTTVTMDQSKTVTAVFAAIELTMAVSPAGAGTTVPAEGGPYPKNLNEVVSIQATPTDGFVFSHWTVSAGSSAADPNLAATTVTMDQSKTVTAVFATLPELTMAVSPAGAGTTLPAVGGPYSKNLNEVVAISAAPEAGYAFSHWTVSAGSAVADPIAASTTVTMDQSKTVTAVFSEIPVVQPQLRAFWADVFHYGLQNAGQVDQMIGLAVQGNYNAIFAEVLAYHDNPVGSHGAYWRSNIVARSSYVTDSFDPLAYMVQQAHANGIELHCWLVAFRVSTAWPPAGNSFLASHPEYLMVPRASIGAGPVKVGSDYVLDPGSPDAQEYLVSIVRELVSNYEIDGINWDYIRYTQTDAGYPADNGYANSGLKRFQRITGRTDVPAATGDTQWNDFRRRTIDELVRRVRAEIPSIPGSRQPLRYTADLITWGDAPANFTSSSAYTLFSNWEYWLRMGWLDGGVPMCYDREYNSTQALYYRHWVDKCMIWRYDRHMYIGQAAYLNTMADSVTQMAYAYNKGAEGTSNYSYYVTVDANMDGTGEHDVAWYPYVQANLFNEPAPTPSMPWRSPATATEGTLWGRVTRGGAPVDDAEVRVGTLPAVRTDGNGWYVVTLIPAAAGGTGYDVTAASGSDSTTVTGVMVAPGEVRQADVVLGQ